MIKLFNIEGYYEWVNIASIMSIRSHADANILSITFFGVENNTRYSFTTQKELDEAVEKIIGVLS